MIINNLEKLFFTTFEIPPIKAKRPKGPIPIFGTYIPKDVPEVEYEEVEIERSISDKAYLELILILLKHTYIPDCAENINEMKQLVLNELILMYQNFSCAVSCDYPFEYQETAREIKEQIQNLFKV